MISEGSCNAKDWSNDAENSAFLSGINSILKYIKIENSFKFWCFSKNIYIYLLIKLSLGEHVEQ